MQTSAQWYKRLAVKIARRTVLAWMAASIAGPAAGQQSDKAELRPGDYVWTPERAPVGPVVVIVSIQDQMTSVYRNGVLIGISSCSTGKPGHRTPTGVFTTLQKRVEHYSSIYKNAPMPYMQRLTWRGIALHAGDLPGYPASAGCIRLPLEFARKLFDVTHMGTPIIVADRKSAPAGVLNSGLLLSEVAAHQAARVVAEAARKDKRSKGGWTTTVEAVVRSIVVSGADRRAIVMRNGRVESEGEIRIKDPGRPLGTQAFALLGSSLDGRELRWMSYGIGGAAAEGREVDRTTSDALSRIEMLDRNEAMRVAMTYRPGTTLVVTDLAARADSRTGPGFVVVDGEPYRMPRPRPKA